MRYSACGSITRMRFRMICHGMWSWPPCGVGSRQQISFPCNACPHGPDKDSVKQVWPWFKLEMTRVETMALGGPAAREKLRRGVWNMYSQRSLFSFSLLGRGRIRHIYGVGYMFYWVSKEFHPMLLSVGFIYIISAPLTHSFRYTTQFRRCFKISYEYQ